MPETQEYSPELNRKRTAVTTFLTTLMTSAKTSLLYKAGHTMGVQISERMVGVLKQALGTEQNLPLEVKAKTVVLEESELTPTAEITLFASALHTLGIGGVLFTNRVTPEGMAEFFRILMSRPDEQKTLTDLQKAVQTTRIDGLQLNFILSFVSTGETEVKPQKPGNLSEEQILAFCRGATLPDFMALLLRQNEELIGKEAEAVTALLDRALYREVPIEKFEAEMPWSLYDPRIRGHWDALRAAAAWRPKSRGAPRADQPRAPRQRWAVAPLLSWAGLYEAKELERLHDRHAHETKESLMLALHKTHAILDHPVGPSQPKYALQAYVRLLAELGRIGRVEVLLQEFDRWTAMREDVGMAPLFQGFQESLREKVVKPVFAEPFVAQLATIPVSDAETLERLSSFAVFMGEGFVPLMLEQLRNVQDKDHRAKLCALLTQVGKAVGVKPLVEALADPDWFLVVNVIGILNDIAEPANAPAVVPCLKNGHPKVRESAVRFLGKFGCPEGAEGLAEFIGTTSHFEETGKAVIALSLLNVPGIGEMLLKAYARTPDYDTKVSVVRGLGRQGSAKAVALLKETARRSWYEILTGLNKELRKASKEALETLKKEGHA